MNLSISAPQAAGTRAPSPHSVLADLSLARKSVRVSVSGSGQETNAPPFALTARTPGDPEPDLTSLVVIHRAMRQDLARLAVALGQMATGQG